MELGDSYRISLGRADTKISKATARRLSKELADAEKEQ